MGFLDRFRRKKRGRKEDEREKEEQEEPGSQGELPPELRQTGGHTPAPTTPNQASDRLQAELAQAALEVRLIVSQLFQPVRDSGQYVQRIRLCQRAMTLVRWDRSPLLWAVLQFELGNAFSHVPTGDRAENLEQAIISYTAALEVHTRTDYPIQWAATQHNLGNVYRHRIQGDRAENLERAAHCKRKLMGLLAEHPELRPFIERMMRQTGSGDRIRTGGPEIARRKIAGAPVKVPPRFRGHISRLQALPNTTKGFEQRVTIYEDILRALPQREAPAFWGAVQHDLGNTYQNRTRGDRAENLEQAIAAYTAALEVRTRTDFPFDWAMTQNGLGNAYSKRIRGDRAENLERAIAAYTAALEVRTRADFPVQWAATQNNLGVAYSDRIRGDRAENLERAIAAYTAALEVRTRKNSPVDWAEIQHNLGTAYADRIQGDRAENLEQAIATFQAALKVYTRADFPVDWAMTQNSLGVAYSDRIRGNRAKNLELAIAAYQAALEVRTRGNFPVGWAMTQNNLGAAYTERIRGDRAENLEQAIAAYTAALGVYTQADFPIEWATTQNNLSTIYAKRIRGDRAENLERAIAAYTAALEVYTRADFPVRWARTQNNLGNVYAERIRGDRAENLERAIAAYQAATDGAQAMGIRDDERKAAGNLGHLHYDERQWSSAYKAFDTAIAALEAMRTAYFSEEAKTRLAEENARLYAQMTDTCLHLDCPQEGLERAEAGKGRIFLDQLGYDAFPAPSLPPAQRTLLEREASLVSELRSLENGIRNAPDEARRREFVAQQGERRAGLDEVWAQLEPHAPDYVALRRGDPVQYNDLQALVDGFGTAAALVEFYTLPDKIIAFVLRSREQEPAVAQVDMSQDRLRRHVQTYWREVVEYSRRGDVGQRWQELAGPLLGDVLPYLQESELVYLVPHGLLHYLPLHGLRVDGGTLIDRFPIAYAPSAAVLGRVIQRTAGVEGTGDGRGALVLGYTPHERERKVFEGEAVQVAEFFGAEAHLGKDATGALLREKGAQHDTLHLSCHGFFDPTDPLASGLQLADGVLTARDIMGLKLNADLVTLSACQTALSDQQPGDELVGLTRALLYAGASSVLVTLWSVSAVAALELMGDFYGRLRGQDGAKVKAEAVALREAMLEMRKQREHPYYWAPFVLVGDWR